MQIADYLAVARRYVMILVLVPLAAVTVVTAQVISQPPSYSATAVVAAPALVGGVSSQYAGTQGVTQFAAAFTGVLESRVVLDAVAEVTGRPVEREGALSIDQVQGSSLMRVSYVTTSKDAAAPVAHAAAAETLRFLFGSQVDLALRQVEEAQKQLAETSQQLANLYVEAGTVEPERTYDTKLQQVSALEQKQVEAAAQGDTEVAADIGSAIDARRAELVELGGRVIEYRNLIEVADSARARLNERQDALAAAQAQLSAADPDAVVHVSGPRALTRGPALIQKVPTAAGAGLVLAVALVASIEMLYGRLSRRASPSPGRRVAPTTRARELSLEGRQ